MPSSSRLVHFDAFVCVLVVSAALAAENTATPIPNSDFAYQQLRNIGLSSEAVAVNDLTLKRDAATGVLLNESNDHDQNVTVWKSEVPQTVAGFNFGKFKMFEVKMTKPEYLVQSYANEEPPEWVKGLQHAAEGNGLDTRVGSGAAQRSEVALGLMGTTGMEKKALADGEISMELYTDFFGPFLSRASP